jgi:hypothetical protein
MTMEAKVWVELWPVAADDEGLWLLSPAALLADHEQNADGDEFATVAWMLDQIGYEARGLDDADRPGVLTVHSTSWRRVGPGIYLTFIAALEPRQGESVPDIDLGMGRPIGLPLAGRVGRPATHAPGRAPEVRDIDVLMHGLRHLSFLVQHDATEADALGPVWARWLAQLEPALAGMYSEVHGRAA